MSIDALRWAWQQCLPRSSQKLVLLALSDRAGEDHTCFPSIGRLCNDTGLDKKTVQSTITDLIALGLVVDTGRRCGRTRRVRILRLVGVPDRYERNGPKNGIIPFLPANDPKSGTIKRSQKRDAEPISFEPTIEPDSMLLSLSDQSQINEWAPSPKVLKTLKYLAVREDFAEEVLELFRDYWEEEGELHTDRQWDWMYLERCLEQRERRAKRVSGGRAAT